MSKKLESNLCPCGSGLIEDHCCGQYISGQRIPATAEALMRSRYTAYTQANISYIQATMREKAAENFDPAEAMQWAKTAKWRRLKVIRTFSDSTPGLAYVEFMAHYISAGIPQKLIETSVFKQIDGRWYYVDRV